MHRFTLRSPVAASLKFTLLPDRLTDLVGFIFSRSAPLPSAPLLSAWCEPGFRDLNKLVILSGNQIKASATSNLFALFVQWFMTKIGARVKETKRINEEPQAIPAAMHIKAGTPLGSEVAKIHGSGIYWKNFATVITDLNLSKKTHPSLVTLSLVEIKEGI